jgi:hypothetical protein
MGTRRDSGRGAVNAVPSFCVKTASKGLESRENMRRFTINQALRAQALLGAALLCLLLPTARAGAQAQKDPLDPDEVEQVRSVADQPPERVKLYMKFIEQRTTAIKQMSSDPHVQNKPAKLRNLMEEFTRLADELQDNLDGYEDSHSDVRKALKDLVAASAKWPDVLNIPPPDRSYDFSRETALEAARSANEEATSILDDQTKYFADHKKDKKSDDQPPPKER